MWLRMQKIVDLEGQNFKKIEILASMYKIKELIDILSIDNLEKKEEELIKFDLKQLEIIYKNMDKIKDVWLNISINLYPITLIKETKKIKKLLKKIENELKKRWLYLYIEIVENWKLNTDNYVESIKEILNSFKEYNFSLDDVIKEETKENSHFIDNIKKILNVVWETNNIKSIKIDIFVLKNNSDKEIIEMLLNLKDVIWNIIIVFEWVEFKEEINKIKKIIKEVNKNIKWNTKISNKNVFIQWFYFSKPKKVK